jgi:hypothetical protein
VQSGDHQSAAPGVALALPLAVLVTDASGAPTAGVMVAFSVANGDGSITDGNAVSGSDGTATCGAWTMPATKGTEHLSASVAGIAPVTFTASSLVTSTDITVTQHAFAPGAIIGDSVHPTAHVASLYAVASVTTTLADRQSPLSFTGASPDEWGGATLDLTGLPKGPVDLLIEAKDIQGQESDLIVPLQLDAAPVLQVTAPNPVGFTATGQLQLAASCHDDSSKGCVSLTASVGATVLASGTASIDQPVDLSAYNGTHVVLVLTGTDDAGQKTALNVDAYVDSSLSIVPRSQVPGYTVDVLDTRSLYSATPSGVVTLYDSGDGSTTPLSNDTLAKAQVGGGFLFPNGAIYLTPTNLHEWRGGAVGDLGPGWGLVVKGSWAALGTQPNSGVALRDLASGTTTALVDNTPWGIDVSPDGCVAYAQFAAVTLYCNGVSTPMHGIAEAQTAPLTDGRLVVYQNHNLGAHDWVAMNDGSTETELTPDENNVLPGSTYAISNGWIAYLYPDTTNHLQVWRHGPSGEQQVTFFGTSTTIDAIAPDGTVVLHTDAGRRYIAAPGQQPTDIAASLGSVIYRDAGFVEIIGGYAFDLTP